MRTLFIWENCDVFDGRRAYWVEVPLEVFYKEIENSIDGKNLYRDNMDDYLASVDRASKDFPDLVKKNHVYLLVREDGLAYEMPAPRMPYSQLWNAYCPLIEFQKEISSLSSLSQIDAPDIDDVLKKGIPMDRSD